MDLGTHSHADCVQVWLERLRAVTSTKTIEGVKRNHLTVLVVPTLPRAGVPILSSKRIYSRADVCVCHERLTSIRHS